MPEVVTHWLADDGDIPNNPNLALILYKAVLDGDSEPEQRFEALFAANGWGGMWVDGIFEFHHYHSTAHEALAVATGQATLMLGGPEGREVTEIWSCCRRAPATGGSKRAGTSPSAAPIRRGRRRTF